MNQGYSAVSWGPGRIDLFWVDDDGSLIHRAFQDGAWAVAESLGGTLVSPPAATAWAAHQLQVFAIFPDGQLWNRYLGRRDLARLGVTRRRPGWRGRRFVVGSRPDRRVGRWPRRQPVAPLLGRNALGRLGTTRSLTSARAVRRGATARSIHPASAVTTLVPARRGRCSPHRPPVAVRSGPRPRSRAAGRARSMLRTAG